MKGLILKDLYTMVKQLKIFLLMIIIFACIPGEFSISSFAIVYAALLPITALAYDERSKWNQLAAMMPYSVKSIVWSKYIFGYIMIGGTFAISVASQLVVAFVTKSTLGEQAMELLLIVCIAIVLLSINMPLMFKFGVEKGRIAFIILTVLTVTVLFSLEDTLFAWVASADWSASIVALVCVAATILVNLASAVISEKVYVKKFA